MTYYKPHQWQWLRSQGFKRCVCNNRTSQSAVVGEAHKSKKGARCCNHVSKELIAERGLPICTDHWPIYQQDISTDAARRAALRAKYDPGPLYDEDDL